MASSSSIVVVEKDTDSVSSYSSYSSSSEDDAAKGALEVRTNRMVATAQVYTTFVDNLNQKFKKAYDQSRMRNQEVANMLQQYSEDFQELEQSNAALLAKKKDLSTQLKSEKHLKKSAWTELEAAKQRHKELFEQVDNIKSKEKAHRLEIQALESRHAALEELYHLELTMSANVTRVSEMLVENKQEDLSAAEQEAQRKIDRNNQRAAEATEKLKGLVVLIAQLENEIESESATTAALHAKQLELTNAPSRAEQDGARARQQRIETLRLLQDEIEALRAQLKVDEETSARLEKDLQAIKAINPKTSKSKAELQEALGELDRQIAAASDHTAVQRAVAAAKKKERKVHDALAAQLETNQRAAQIIESLKEEAAHQITAARDKSALQIKEAQDHLDVLKNDHAVLLSRIEELGGKLTTSLRGVRPKSAPVAATPSSPVVLSTDAASPLRTSAGRKDTAMLSSPSVAAAGGAARSPVAASSGLALSDLLSGPSPSPASKQRRSKHHSNGHSPGRTSVSPHHHRHHHHDLHHHHHHPHVETTRSISPPTRLVTRTADAHKDARDIVAKYTTPRTLSPLARQSLGLLDAQPVVAPVSPSRPAVVCLSHRSSDRRH